MATLNRMLLLCMLAAGASPAPASTPVECGNSALARQLAELIQHDPGQQRDELRCNALLSEIAETKAREMAELGQVAHLGRSAANARLARAGYPLAGIYPRLLENNVEAIAGGIAEPAAVWAAFKASEAHRSHLLGAHEFYRLQDEIGVGYFRDPASPHVDYWVVYIAHRGDDPGYRGQIATSKD